MPHRASGYRSKRVSRRQRAAAVWRSRHRRAEPPTSLAESAQAVNFDEVAQAALDIARQTGRVTNTSLREVVPIITSEEARDVFRALIERGQLVRRGVKRGTHYVPADEQDGGGGAPTSQPGLPKRLSPSSPLRPFRRESNQAAVRRPPSTPRYRDGASTASPSHEMTWPAADRFIRGVMTAQRSTRRSSFVGSGLRARVPPQGRWPRQSACGQFRLPRGS